MQPPQIALQPGSTNTAAVKQLQDWLVANNYMTQAQVNTGYGTYGPQTTAAVQAVQQKLGVDNSTGPGYWGPRTLAAVTSAGTTVNQPAPTPSSTANSTTPAASPVYSMVSAAVDQIQQKATLGAPVRDFSQAMDEASKDPRIVAKYGDMAKMDAQSFGQSIQQLQQSYSTQADQQKTQFENDRKALADQQASAGTAYSGFRGKAQADLAQTEGGIVSSSRSQLQKSLNDATSQFEQKYGTGATPTTPITIANPLSGNTTLSGLQTNGGGTTSITGQIAGGITGTEVLDKEASIANSANIRYGQDNPAPM